MYIVTNISKTSSRIINDCFYNLISKMEVCLKVGYVIFQKRFRKLSRGRVPKQTCSQSAVCLLIIRVGYHLNFIDFDSDSDSAYRFRFFSIPSFDSNVIK